MKKNQGFTLIELSIVLVIIGLLVGSITVGRSMIRTSEMRSAISEYDRTLKAMGEFRDKYYALPGDMNNAESNWGSDAGCPNTSSNSNPKIATCNGDGNGHTGDSTTAGVLSNSREWFRAWQQLGNAGFIDGHFTGTPGAGSDSEAKLGVNVPASGLGGAGWTLFYLLMTSDDILWADQYGHVMVLGAPRSASYTYDPIITPTEALEMDVKMDDGKPGSGKIRAFRTSRLANCTNNDTTQTAQTYNVDYKTNACSLVFIPGF